MRFSLAIPGALWRAALSVVMTVVLLSLAALLSACGGGDDNAPPAAPTEASAVIGPAGGTLDGPDGARVVIPAGALAADTTITIAKRDTGAPTVLPDGFAASGATYEFTPHDIVFAQPVTLRMPFASNPQATAQDVLRASPGEPWLPLQLSPANGFAEWQSATFSWYSATECAWTGPNPDPYPCSSAGGNTVLTATAGTAPTLFWQGQSTRYYRATAAATLQLTITFSGPPDCGDLRVDFKRRRASDARAVVLATVQPTLTQTTPGSRVRGTASFTVDLSDADNGRTVLIAHGSCRRAYQSPSRASLTPEQQRIGAADVFVFETQIAQPPAPVAPQVTQQPAAVSVTAPATATFSASASGSPAPDVQWQMSTDSGASWSDIAGATAFSHTTSATSVADNGKQFRAMFTNSAGSITSNAALLSVAAAPATPAFADYWGKLSLAYNFSCALRADSTLACWGYNSSGQLGQGNGNSQSVPVTFPLPGAAKSVATGGSGTTCAIHGNNDQVSCAGSAVGASRVPIDLGLSDITAVAASYGHMCVVSSNGMVDCKGQNSEGELGDGTTTLSATFVRAQTGLINGDAGAISAGDVHTCAVRRDGTVVCWGAVNRESNGAGQLVATPVPSTVPGLSSVVQVAAATMHTCALSGGNVACWGHNDVGQLGQGTTSAGYTATPLWVPNLTQVVAIAAGGRMTCALSDDGSVRCWGYGMMGNGSQGATTQTTPQLVGGLTNMRAIAVGNSHACALRADQRLFCWGSNADFALGSPGPLGDLPREVTGGAVFWKP